MYYVALLELTSSLNTYLRINYEEQASPQLITAIKY
jgi:hypothetical protein